MLNLGDWKREPRFAINENIQGRDADGSTQRRVDGLAGTSKPEKRNKTATTQRR